MTAPIDVGMVTCAQFPDLVDDDQALANALIARGLVARPLVWDDPDADWSSTRMCIIRSTWDYPQRREEFLAWAETTSMLTSLWNGPEVVRWNTHKSYLRDLEHRGIPITPTAWLPAGSQAGLARLLAERGWDRAVIKPAVSANAFATIITARGATGEGQAHLDKYLPSLDMMVQPYLASVESYGERSLVFLDGELTHAARRVPVLIETPDWTADHRYVEPAEDEVNLASRVLRAVDMPILYARVDIARDDAGSPLLMELELVEPSLFLRKAPHAVSRFADAIVRLLAT